MPMCAATCSHSGRRCTRWSPAPGRSTPTRTAKSWRRFSTRAGAAVGAAPLAPPALARSSRRASPRIGTSGGRRRRTSCESCGGSRRTGGSRAALRLPARSRGAAIVWRDHRGRGARHRRRRRDAVEPCTPARVSFVVPPPEGTRFPRGTSTWRCPPTAAASCSAPCRPTVLGGCGCDVSMPSRATPSPAARARSPVLVA